MPSPLSETISELAPVMRRGDLYGFQRLFERLHDEGRGLSPDELTLAVGELVPALRHRPTGVFARLALTAGAFVEWGASPLALAQAAPAHTLQVMQQRLVFSWVWPVVARWRRTPDPADPPTMDSLVRRFTRKADRLGLSEGQATSVALSWFDVNHWINLMITAMMDREFRAATEPKKEIAEAAAELCDDVERAHWLVGLAQVLDDEPLVVLDAETGRGFRLSMSGIGDNFQLHTLLADRLIGDPAQGLLTGARPEPSWVAAASTGPTLPPDGPIRRSFRLYDASGAYVYPEGRPADIAVRDGARVIVVHPPRGDYFWNSGRTYESMAPTLTVDHILTADEAAAWRPHLTPARQNDLFADQT